MMVLRLSMGAALPCPLAGGVGSAPVPPPGGNAAPPRAGRRGRGSTMAGSDAFGPRRSRAVPGRAPMRAWATARGPAPDAGRSIRGGPPKVERRPVRVSACCEYRDCGEPAVGRDRNGMMACRVCFVGGQS